MTQKLLILLISLFPAAAFAGGYGVRAQVVDSAGVPEAYATYRIFALPDTIKPVAGALTGDDGLIVARLDSAGDYRMDVAGMSAHPETRLFKVDSSHPEVDLGELRLRPATTMLSELTVTAMKPLVTREIDRIGYDVKNDIEAPTSNLSDILKKVPMVSVEPDGTIKINGSSDFKIYKNGRPNNSFTKNAKDIFKALPASSIKKVEVITDPGAREDAEGVGAILNIVTDSETSVKGVLGTVSLWANTNNLVPNPNVWLSSQIDKVTFSVNGGFYSFNEREGEGESLSEGTYASSGITSREVSTGKSRGTGYYGGAEASFELDTLNLFTAEVNFYNGRNKYTSTATSEMFSPAGELIQSYTSVGDYPRNSYLDLDAGVNYQRSTRLKGEAVTLSYRISTTNQQQQQSQTYENLFNPPMLYKGIISDFDLNFIEQTAQVDWTRPFGEKHKLDVGGKFIHRNNHSKNSREYVGERSTFDDFSHRTSIGAAYADYRVSFGKFSARAGLRYEFSRLSAKFIAGEGSDFGSNLNDFAPNVALSYNVNDATTLKLSYNRRINRPGISYLDPTVAEAPNSTSSGNPYLHSATQNSIRLNYGLIKPKFNVDANVSFDFSNDQISSLTYYIDEHRYSTYGNINRFRNVNLSLYMQWSPFEKTSIMINFNGGYQHYNYPKEGKTLSRWRLNPYVYVRQKLPWKLTLSGNMYYWTGSTGSIYSYVDNDARSIGYSFNLQRDFLKEDRLSVRVGVQNPFGPSTSTYRNVSVNTDYQGTSTSYGFHRRSVNFSVSYRFGSLMASVKKTAASINNDDLSGRKN